MTADTETLDRLYLEWSQFTDARNAREIEMVAEIERLNRIIHEMDTMGFSKLQAEVLHPPNRMVAADYGSDRGN